MPPAVSVCEAHGYVGGEACPVCGERGRRVLSGERRRRLSKFVSGALRHFPEDAGITLDEAGWTAFPALVEAVERQYDWADREALAAVVATDPKGRFERTGGDGQTDATGPVDGTERPGDGWDGTERVDATGQGDRIRAAYGHSVDVDLDAAETPVPDTLYHGTAPRNAEAIRAEGIRPMDRQQVHLSGTVEAAREVGRRHAADPVVLAVDAAGLEAAGHAVTRRGRGVYTTDRVPPEFLTTE